MKRRGSGSKQKGASYERSVCQRLSMWVSNLTREDCFWRSAMSGGRATLKSRKNSGIGFGAQAGDITPTHALGLKLCELFVIDAKHYADFKTERQIFGRRSDLLREWKKLRETARSCKKQAMLVCRQNRRPEIIVVSPKGLEILEKGGILKPTCVFPRNKMNIVLFRDMLMLNFDRIRGSIERRRMKE